MPTPATGPQEIPEWMRGLHKALLHLATVTMLGESWLLLDLNVSGTLRTVRQRLTPVIQGMEEAGFIKRHPSRDRYLDDLFSITDAGRELLKKPLAEWAAELAKASVPMQATAAQ